MLLKKNKHILIYLFYTIYCIPIIFAEDTSIIVDKELAKVSEHISQEDFTQALALLYILSNKYPHNNHVYRLYASVSLKLRDYDRAVTFIEQAISLAETESENYMLAGNIYREKDDFNKAKQYYESAISLSPNRAIIYYEYALLNLKNSYIQDAERLLSLSTNFDETAWYNMLLKAQIAQYKQEYQAAQKIFFEIIDQFPYEEILLDEFAKFYLLYKKPEKALVILETANKRFGEKFERIKIIGNILFEQGLYDKALLFYKKIDSLSTMFYKDIATLKWRMYNLDRLIGQKEMAINNLKQAFESDPNNQLYISTLYEYFSHNPSDKDIANFVSFLEKTAKKEKLQGMHIEYLCLLKKILHLRPNNNAVKKQLINYAKLNKDEYAIGQFIQSMYQSDPDKHLANQIAVRNHLSNTKQLAQDISPIYEYTNLVFIEDNLDYIAKAIRTEIENIESFIPNIHSVFELEKKFKNESRHIFINNSQFNLVTYIQINADSQYLDIMIFDKSGIPIDNIKQYYSNKLLTKYLIAYSKKLASLLPPIGTVLKKLPDSKYEISLGTMHSLEEKTPISILNKDAQAIATATAENVSLKTAIVKLDTIPIETLEIGSTLATIKNLTHTNQKQENNDNSSAPSFYLLDRIFQIRYKKYESLSEKEEN